MKKFKNILVVSDGKSWDADVFTQALSTARITGGDVSVFIACPSLPRRLSDYVDSYENSLKERVESSLAEARASLGMDESSIPVRIEIESGPTPGERMVRRAIQDECDLLLKQADSSEKGKGFRAIDMDLLRKCPCPVWLSRPIERQREKIRVAVAIDPMSEEPAGHDLSIRLLTLARSLADTCSAELTIISCWEYEMERYLLYNAWHRVPRSEVRSMVADEETEHREALNAVVQESGIEGDLVIRHVRGQPERVIPDIVEEEDVDILVMGTVARTGVPGFIIGNTAENVLSHLECSLIALKPPGFNSPVKL